MADDDRPKRDDPDGDPDRAAILARRQRFIAIALSGLAGAAACDGCGPKPCLNIATPDSVDPPNGDDPKDGAPHPCLSAVPEPDPVEPGDPKAKPQPCLEVARDPDADPKPQP